MAFFNAGLNVPNNSNIKINNSSGVGTILESNSSSVSDLKLILPSTSTAGTGKVLQVKSYLAGEATLSFETPSSGVGDSLTTEVVYNNAGTLDGVSTMTFNNVTELLNISGNTTITAAAHHQLNVSSTKSSTSTSTGALVVGGGVGIGQNLYVGNDLAVTGNLTVNGTTTTINSNITTIDDPVIELGTLVAPADSYDRGLKIIYNNAGANVGFFGLDQSASVFTYFSDAVFSGSNVVNDGTSTRGNAIFNNLTLEGTLDVSAASNIDSTLDVTGATNLYNTLDVSGLTTLAATNITGASNINSTLDVTGATDIFNTLNVTGTTTLAATNISGASNINSTLDVTGATNIYDTLSVTGATTLAASNVDSTLDVTSATNLYSTLDVSGATTLSSTLALSGVFNLGVDTLQSISSVPSSNLQIISSTASSSVKHLVSNISSAQFHSNAGSQGDLLHLFYSGNAGASAQLIFNGAGSNLYSGTGKATNGTLTFTNAGQSATLIYLSANTPAGTAAGWRIINTGAAVS